MLGNATKKKELERVSGGRESEVHLDKSERTREERRGSSADVEKIPPSTAKLVQTLIYPTCKLEVDDNGCGKTNAQKVVGW